MIVTEPLSIEEITSHLHKEDKISIISCNACSKICGTGGQEAIEKLAFVLKEQGFTIVDMDLIGNPCNSDMLNKLQLHGNVQIVMSCDAGVENVKRIYPDQKVVASNKTIGVGIHEGGKKVTVVREF